MVGGKIFCTGLYRTGTSSLHLAVTKLGYRSIHHHAFLRMVERMNTDAGRRLLWGVESMFDVFIDGRIMYLFRELDRQYPGSKFICTQRDEDSWVRSVMNRRIDDTLRRVPMLAECTEEQWREHHRQHYARVRAYFAARPADVLYMNICDGEQWERLCELLNVPVPDVPFPRENAAEAAIAPFWQPIR